MTKMKRYISLLFALCFVICSCSASALAATTRKISDDFSRSVEPYASFSRAWDMKVFGGQPHNAFNVYVSNDTANAGEFTVKVYQDNVRIDSYTGTRAYSEEFTNCDPDAHYKVTVVNETNEWQAYNCSIASFKE